MQIRTICVLFTILLCGCRPAGAQNSALKPGAGVEAIRAQAAMFKPAYRRYIELIGTQGFASLKKITTSNFTFKAEETENRSKGKTDDSK